MSERLIVWTRFPLHQKKIYFSEMRWWHHLLYKIPVVRSIGASQFRRGHGVGAKAALVEGYNLAIKGNGRKLSQRDIARALDSIGVKIHD